jgi:hypothetical protein
MVVHAQFVKQNTKLLQVLTKQEEGDMATNKDQLLPEIAQSDYQVSTQSTWRNLWSSGKAKYSDMVAQ